MNFEELERIKRSQFKTFLDTTPSGNSRTWKLEGWGVEEAGIDYGAQTDRIRYIIEDNARTDHTGNEKQMSITKRTYKGEPVFEFVNGARDKLNYKTHILEVDSWNESDSTYPAKMTDGLIVITNYSGSEIEYDLYFDGDTTEGTVTFADGVPTFTPTASL
jgi:hypothetical protein